MADTLWHEIAPKDALDIRLPAEGITSCITSTGEVCPWPWEPQQLKGAPIGMYHCPYCGDMVVAGLFHADYSEGPDDD